MFENKIEGLSEDENNKNLHMKFWNWISLYLIWNYSTNPYILWSIINCTPRIDLWRKNYTPLKVWWKFLIEWNYFVCCICNYFSHFNMSKKGSFFCPPLLASLCSIGMKSWTHMLRLICTQKFQLLSNFCFCDLFTSIL